MYVGTSYTDQLRLGWQRQIASFGHGDIPPDLRTIITVTAEGFHMGSIPYVPQALLRAPAIAEATPIVQGLASRALKTGRRSGDVSNTSCDSHEAPILKSCGQLTAASACHRRSDNMAPKGHASVAESKQIFLYPYTRAPREFMNALLTGPI